MLRPMTETKQQSDSGPVLQLSDAYRGLLSTPPPATTHARSFIVYNGYRVLLGAGLLMLMVVPATANIMMNFDRPLLVSGIGILLTSALVLIGPLGKALQQSETGYFGLLLLDILTITLFASASGGILGGFSALYLITVAAAAVLFQTRILATLVAAIAVLALLIDTLWLVTRGDADVSMMLPAGILGSLFFAVSLLVQVLASRLSKAEAERRSAESQVAALQQLNEQIILRMETGILLARDTGQCHPINAAARRLLNLDEGQRTTLSTIAPELGAQFSVWLKAGRVRPEPFRAETDGPALIANFASLDSAIASDKLVFVDDYTPVTQFAQSLKLNSLSKLTASIAHEIRNPLSAISHAAQLLSESPTVDAADAVLCDILVNNSARVSDIIQNVMDVSRREPPRQILLALATWLRNFHTIYSEQRTQPCDLLFEHCDPDLTIQFDPKHLERIMTNLIDNGLRHSHDDTGHASVSVVVERDNMGGQLHIDIIDGGFGVPDNLMPRLFEPFFTTSQDGSGLGLYLCKELCELNGAELGYRKTAAGESSFRVSLRMEQK